MIALYFPDLDKELVLPEKQNIKIVKQISVLSLSDFGYTFSPEFTLKKNAYIERFFEFLSAPSNIINTQPTFDCVLTINGETFLRGELKILKTQPDYQLLLTADAAIFSQLKEKKLADFIPSKTVYASHLHETGVAIVSSRDKEQKETKLTACPYILPLLHQVCNTIHYKLRFEGVPTVLMTVIARSFLFSTYETPNYNGSNSDEFDYINCLPKTTLGKFLKGFSMTFGLFPKIDHFAKTITYQPLVKSLDSTAMTIDHLVTKVETELLPEVFEELYFDTSLPEAQNEFVIKGYLEIDSFITNEYSSLFDEKSLEGYYLLKRFNRLVHVVFDYEEPVNENTKRLFYKFDILEDQIPYRPSTSLKNPFKILINEAVEFTIKYDDVFDDWNPIYNHPMLLEEDQGTGLLMITCQIYNENGMEEEVDHVRTNWPLWIQDNRYDYFTLEDHPVYKGKIHVRSAVKELGTFTENGIEHRVWVIKTDTPWKNPPRDNNNQIVPTAIQGGTIKLHLGTMRKPVHTDELAISQMIERHIPSTEIIGPDFEFRDYASEIPFGHKFIFGSYDGYPLRQEYGLGKNLAMFNKLRKLAKPVTFHMTTTIHEAKVLLNTEVLNYQGGTYLVERIEGEVKSGDYVELETQTFKI